MKIKMKKTLIGAIGNGEVTITYEEGKTYEMKTLSLTLKGDAKVLARSPTPSIFFL